MLADVRCGRSACQAGLGAPPSESLQGAGLEGVALCGPKGAANLADHPKGGFDFGIEAIVQASFEPLLGTVIVFGALAACGDLEGDVGSGVWRRSAAMGSGGNAQDLAGGAV